MSFAFVVFLGVVMRKCGLFKLEFFKRLFSHFYGSFNFSGNRTVKYKGTSFVVDSSDMGIVPALIRGDFESGELDYLYTNIMPREVFVDIGANIGIYSVLASRLVGSKGMVYSFEPEKNNVELLKRNMKNVSTGNYRIFQFAISDKNGYSKLYVNQKNKGSHRMHKVGLWKSRKVRTVRLDDVLNGRKVDFVKIDVEGHEIEVLKGMKNIIKNNPQIQIIAEFNPELMIEAGYTPTDFFFQIRNMGLKILRFDNTFSEIEYLEKRENVLCVKA